MNESRLEELLAAQEGQHLEFKREWYDLSKAREKAEFARDVMAMANGLAAGQQGHIVIGKEDPARGGAVVGVDEVPDTDRLTNVLGQHTRPPPDIVLFPKVTCGGRAFSVIEVRWSPAHPHYSTRDVDGVLSTDRVLARFGATIRGVTPPELETMIRAKDARVGNLRVEDPLEVGFVELPRQAGEDGAIRIRNLSDDPITDIWGHLDVKTVFPEGFTERMQVVSNLTLKPEESREFRIQPRHAHFYYPDGRKLHDGHPKTWWHWTDLVLRVTYRDRSGLIAEVVRTASLR